VGELDAVSLTACSIKPSGMLSQCIGIYI
jgi:hypothetical protein